MHYNIDFNTVIFYCIFERTGYVYVRGEWEQNMFIAFIRQKPGKKL